MQKENMLIKAQRCGLTGKGLLVVVLGLAGILVMWLDGSFDGFIGSSVGVRVPSGGKPGHTEDYFDKTLPKKGVEAEEEVVKLKDTPDELVAKPLPPAFPPSHVTDTDTSLGPCTRVGGCRKNITAVVYNRAPKCGSRTVLSTMKVACKRNAVNVYDLQPPSSNREFLEETWEDVRRNFSSLYTSPFLYSQHVHFFDFNRNSREPTTAYVNVVRDPIERLVSHYYFRQYGDANSVKSTSNSTLTLDDCLEQHGAARSCLIPDGSCVTFLCGHGAMCRHVDADSVQEAKRNIEKHYLVVGLTENIPGFLSLLEYLLPGFFTGVAKDYDKRGVEQHEKYKTSQKKELTSKSRELLRTYLAWDYELYYFIASRFYSQYDKFLYRDTLDNDGTRHQ